MKPTVKNVVEAIALANGETITKKNQAQQDQAEQKRRHQEDKETRRLNNKRAAENNHRDLQENFGELFREVSSWRGYLDDYALISVKREDSSRLAKATVSFDLECRDSSGYDDTVFSISTEDAKRGYKMNVCGEMRNVSTPEDGLAFFQEVFVKAASKPASVSRGIRTVMPKPNVN